MEKENTNNVCLQSYEENDFNYAEAIKTLRTNIQFSGSNIKAVMFTSSVPDEGKSETSFQLAKSLAQLGRRVLFIDADIRKSVTVARYQLEKAVHGLSQYLSSQVTRDQVVYETNIPQMDMIFAGPYSPNPAELLEGDLFEMLMRWARMTYDYVIIDTPPMGNLIDGAVVSRLCDGAVIVIESGRISYRLLQKVKNQLDAGGCRILGAVLNRVDVTQGIYYRHYGKYGDYEYISKERKNNKRK